MNKLNDTDDMDKIGEGTGGIIFDLGNNYVLKKFKDNIDPSSIREILILKYLCHPNIIKVNTHINNNKISLIMKKAKMDLQKFINLNNITKEQRPFIIWQILNALKYINSHNITHRDLKPSNILVFNECDIKICDFGSSKLGILNGKTHTDVITTLPFRSPESILNPGLYNFSVDIWSVGVILLNIISGQSNFPFKMYEHDGEIVHLFNIFKLIGTPNEKIWPGISKFIHWKETFPKFKGNIDKVLSKTNISDIEYDLLKKMISWPLNRINVSDALNHEYFKGCKYLNTTNIANITNCNICNLSLFNTLNMDIFFEKYKEIIFSFLFNLFQNGASYLTLLVCFNIYNVYSNHCIIEIPDIQLIGSACLIIASNMIDLEAIGVCYVNSYTNKYSKNELTNAVLTILKFFNFEIINIINMVYKENENEDIIIVICSMIIFINDYREMNYNKMSKIASLLINKEESLEVDFFISKIKNMKECHFKTKVLQCINKPKQMFIILFKKNRKIFTKTYCDIDKIEKNIKSLISSHNDYYKLNVMKKDLSYYYIED